MHLISYSGSTSNSLEAEWPCHPTLAQTTPHKLLFAPSFGSYSKQGRVELDLFAPQQLATTYHSPFPATEVPRSPCSPWKRAKKLVAMQKVPGLLCNKFLHGVPAQACTYSEFRRTSNSVSRSVSRSGLRDGKFMVGKVQCFYIVTYGKNKS